MPGKLRVEPIRQEQMQKLLPLIAAYQRFYGVEEIDGERNSAFFSASSPPQERGAHHLEWATAPDNKAAQRLYDSTGAGRSEWSSTS